MNPFQWVLSSQQEIKLDIFHCLYDVSIIWFSVISFKNCRIESRNCRSSLKGRVQAIWRQFYFTNLSETRKESIAINTEIVIQVLLVLMFAKIELIHAYLYERMELLNCPFKNSSYKNLCLRKGCIETILHLI